MTEPVAKLVGVIKDYGDEISTRVLRGIDLEIGAGELTSLIGPSGSGKSTLLNLIGLLDRPTAGTIAIRGQDTGALDDEALTALRAYGLGFVFQFHHLIAALSAAENVMMPLAVQRGRTEPAMRQRATEALALVGLAHKVDAPPRKLSGGEQQRVAIARAIVAHPPLVLADEPTGNLDSKNSDDVFALMRRLNQELGTAFLIVTHDPQIAARCGRTIEIVDGSIVRDELRR